MPRPTNIEKGKKKQLEFVRMTPYLCLTCGAIQLKYTEPGNCDRSDCEGAQIERCGPRQQITFQVYHSHAKVTK
jgi:hypothetical protein